MWKLVLSAGVMAGAVVFSWWLTESGKKLDAKAEEELRQMEEHQRRLDELEATARRVQAISDENERFLRDAMAKIATYH
jgi:hypothetical protein